MSEHQPKTPENSSPFEELAKTSSFEDLRATEIAESISQLKSLGADYRKLENDFAKIDFSTLGSHLPPEKQTSYADFIVEKHENALRENRFLADLNIKNANITNPYALASYEQISTSHPEKTIEVASARFYSVRLNALRQVATADENAILDQTFNKVYEHVAYEYIDRDKITDSYNDDRTAAHNRLIDHLGEINDIARSHDLTPFTARNFLSSAGYDQKRDPGRFLAQRLSSDRAIVARYFDLAFPSQVTAIRRKFQRESDYF